jgi:gas vesicle protein
MSTNPTQEIILSNQKNNRWLRKNMSPTEKVSYRAKILGYFLEGYAEKGNQENLKRQSEKLKESLEKFKQEIQKTV